MYRSGLSKLITWKNNPKRKPLIIWGARQVGKTYLVKELFAKTEFAENYIYIDMKEEREIREYCMENINPKEILSFISVMKNQSIKKNTLLIFDEGKR